MKKILIIGGTRFIGKALTEQLRSKTNQYDLTLFNRGKTNPNLFPEIKRIQGDRNTKDIQKFTNQNWDVIVDICGFHPNPIDTMLDALEGKVGRYIYVSTTTNLDIDKNNTQPANEATPLDKCTKEQRDNLETYAFYNEKKAECERVIESKHWLNSLIIRPGLVVGPYDYSDRLYYWFYKMHTQQKLLVPNEGKELKAFTDVRDLAAILVKSIDINNNYRVYNAISYNAPIRAFLDAIKANTNNKTEYVSAPHQFLKEHKVALWTGLPLWLDSSAFQIDNARIKKDFNMTFRTVKDTTKHLLTYCDEVLQWRKPKEQGAISDEKEKELMDLLSQ